RHTRFSRDWSSDVCSSDLSPESSPAHPARQTTPERWEYPVAPRVFLPVRPQRAARYAHSATTAGHWSGSPPNPLTWRVRKTGERSEERRVGKECRGGG